MEDRFKDISANNDLDFYLNVKNISNSNFTFDIIEYFESGERKGVFEPLDFFNILWIQFEFVNNNISKPFKIINQIQSLGGLNDEEKHILLAILIRYYKQYYPEYLSNQHIVTIEFLKRTFLEYPYQTPEKDYYYQNIDNTEINKNYLKPKNFTHANLENFNIENDLDWFFNVNNIQNYKLVFYVYNYVVYGERVGFIEPALLLNLIKYFDEFIDKNLETPFLILKKIKETANNEEVEHLILGFLLLWHGGYPVSKEFRDEQIFVVLRLIERSFLSYQNSTPEKEYCKKSWLDIQTINDIHKKLNLSINGYEIPQIGLNKDNESFLNSLISQIEKKQTISDKLDYWVDIQLHFKDLYPQVTYLNIPTSVFNNHFEPYSKEIEFGKWFLEYLGKNYLQILYRTENWKGTLESNQKETIEGKLKPIYEVENYARLHLKNNEFDIFKPYISHSIYRIEIEYLRIIDGYYDKHLFDYQTAFDAPAVIAYAKHILLKKELEERLFAIQNNPKVEEVKETVSEAKIIIQAKKEVKGKPKDAPSHIFEAFKEYKVYIEKGNTQSFALSNVARAIMNDANRKFYKSEIEKNVADSLRRDFKKYSFI